MGVSERRARLEAAVRTGRRGESKNIQSLWLPAANRMLTQAALSTRYISQRCCELAAFDVANNALNDVIRRANETAKLLAAVSEGGR